MLPDKSLETKSLRYWAPRILSIAVGLVLLSAGLIKSAEIELFIRQIRGYGIITDHTILLFCAWALIIIECVFGTALIIDYRRKIALPVSILLFIVFIMATGWAWFTGITEDCGCFGSWVSRTPGEALIEDIILVTVLIISWVGTRHPSVAPGRVRHLILSLSLVAGLVLPPIFGLPFSSIDQELVKENDNSHQLSEFPTLDGIDLQEREFLIVLFDPDCSHCLQSFDDLNFLAQEDRMPKLIALSRSEADQIDNFINQYQPLFPIKRIKDDIFWALLGDADLPRVFLINDGKILKVWDGIIPEPSEITSYPCHSPQ